jgi:hypothetical protein
MKLRTAAATVLLATVTAAFAQQPGGPPADPAQAKLREAFAILSRNYPKTEGRRIPKAPADAVWTFRGADGTAEVGFQAGEIVYMIFRRGLGGGAWKHEEIAALYRRFYTELLKEKELDERYTPTVAKQINAGLIVRKDFDSRVLLTGS